MGAEGVGVVEGLTVVVVLLRLSRVKPALGLDDLFSVKLTTGASPFSGVGRFVGAVAFPGAFAGVLRKYLTKKHIGNTTNSRAIPTQKKVDDSGNGSATFCACSALVSPA